jgi:hypothetical protein
LLPGVDPAGDAMLVPVALGQRGSFVIDNWKIHGRWVLRGLGARDGLNVLGPTAADDARARRLGINRS